MSHLRAVAVGLRHLRSALAEHLCRLSRLPADLRRALVKLLTELAATLLLELDRLVLHRRGHIAQLRLRLIDEPFGLVSCVVVDIRLPFGRR